MISGYTLLFAGVLMGMLETEEPALGVYNIC